MVAPVLYQAVLARCALKQYLYSLTILHLCYISVCRLTIYNIASYWLPLTAEYQPSSYRIMTDALMNMQRQGADKDIVLHAHVLLLQQARLSQIISADWMVSKTGENFLSKKRRNIHLNVKFPPKIAKFSLQKHNFPKKLSSPRMIVNVTDERPEESMLQDASFLRHSRYVFSFF